MTDKQEVKKQGFNRTDFQGGGANSSRGALTYYLA